MTTPSDNVLTIWNFTVELGTVPTEIAQLGVWASPGDGFPTTSADWDTYLADLAQAAADAWSSDMPDGNFTAELLLKNAKTIHYDASGNTANEGQASPSSAWAGTGGASLPWQISQVVGLYSYTPGSFIPHARQRRGRVYLPALSTGMMAASGDTAGTGLFDQTKAVANRDGLKATLHSVASTMSTPGRGFIPMVYSRVAAHLYAVTDVVTDVKADIQRRRADKLVMPRLSTSY